MSSFEWPPAGGGAGVTSLNTLSGDLTLVGGTGITITPSGSNITIASTSQPAGNYITALTGDGTASGPGSAVLTLATVNVSPGLYGDASHALVATVNAKGLITGMASTNIIIAESQVTNLVSDLAGKQATGNYITALTGDATASGPGSAALTLATVNANVGSFGSASGVATFTVGAKGLVTAAGTTSIQITESQVTNLTTDLAGKQATVSFAAVGSTPSANGGGIASGVITLQPASGTLPGLLTASAQTIGGAKTFASTLSASNLSGTNTGDQTITLTGDVTGSGTGSFATTLAATTNGTLTTLSASSGVAVHGSNTNNAASAGYVGEWIASAVTSINAGTSTQWADLTSISLTAGDWDVTGVITSNLNGAVAFTQGIVGLSTTSGNSSTGMSPGDNQQYFIPPSSTALTTACVPSWRLSLSTTTTVYLKYNSTYSSGTPLYFGRISARRMR